MFVCLFTVFFYIFFIKNLNMDQFWSQIFKNGPKQVLNVFFRGGFYMDRLPFPMVQKILDMHAKNGYYVCMHPLGRILFKTTIFYPRSKFPFIQDLLTGGQIWEHFYRGGAAVGAVEHQQEYISIGIIKYTHFQTIIFSG